MNNNKIYSQSQPEMGNIIENNWISFSQTTGKCLDTDLYENPDSVKSHSVTSQSSNNYEFSQNQSQSSYVTTNNQTQSQSDTSYYTANSNNITFDSSQNY
jgi:hypothetical protein